MRGCGRFRERHDFGMLRLRLGVVMKRLLLALCLLVGMASPCLATDGNELYEACTVGSNAGGNFCRGYVLAVFETVSNTYFCPPDNIAVSQAVDIVVNFLRAYPEHRNEGAAMLSVSALRIAWPCPKKK